MRGEGVNKNTKFYGFLARILDPIVTIFYRSEIHGYEGVPEDSGYVLTPNHDNAFDPIFMSYFHYYFRRPIHWLSKVELFQPLTIKVLGLKLTVSGELMTKFMYGVRCIPIDRAKPGKFSVAAVLSVLRNGGVVGIFPEGTRHKDRDNAEDLQLKAGAIRFAMKAGVPVVPVKIKSTKPSLWPLSRGSYVVEYGTPIMPNRSVTIEDMLEFLRIEMEQLGCFDS
jgi:1-acyl-sn-glycerol-3-phosphate acyltransferase